MTMFSDNELLRNAVLTAEVNPQEQQKMQEGVLEKVLVYQKTGKTVVLFRFADPPAAETLIRTSCALASGLGTDVELYPAFHGQGPLCDYLRENVSLLKEYIGRESMLIRGSLMAVRSGLQGEVELVFNAQTAVDYLRRKNIQDRIRTILAMMASEPLDPVCIVETDAEFTDHIQELQRQRLTRMPPPGQPKQGANTGSIIRGKDIRGKVIPMEQITEEERNVACQGRVSDLELKKLRSGRTLVVFHLLSKTSGITVKYFEEETDAPSGILMKNGQSVRVRGQVQQDRYTQELTLIARDINEFAPDCQRQDQAPVKRVELHLHTRMSALDGMTDLEEVLTRAHQWGHPALAITDHGGVQAFPNAHGFLQKKGWDMKLIYGMEAYFVNDLLDEESPKRPYHLILLVRNQEGFRNLYRLVTSSNLNHFHRRPRILASELVRYRDGLVLGSACEAGEIFQSILNEEPEDRLQKRAELYDYLEIQPTGNNAFLLRDGRVGSEDILKEFNRKILSLGRQLDKPVVATCDVHFLDPEDAIYREIIQKGQGYSDTTQPPLYFRTTEEMLKEFSWLGKEECQRVVLDSPRQVADWIDKDLVPVQTTLHTPKIEGAETEIQELCREEALRLYGDPLPELVEKRMKKELHSIVTHGFAVLYLIARKLVKKSNEDGYLVGSRGSVGSSFAATLLGVTEVNPLPPHYRCPDCRLTEFVTDGSFGCGADMPDRHCPRCQASMAKDGHDIPFETFLGFNGDKVPDIDLNFSGEYQPVIHKYTEVLFGAKNVFKAGTIATVADKTAFGFVKKYQEEMGHGTTRIAETLALAAGCTGVKRTTGQHPGGIIVLPQGEDINRFTPLQRPADDIRSDIVTSHFDYHSIDASLVKLDLLGHDDPTVIRMLEDLTGTRAVDIRLDDPTTMSLFSSTEALDLDPAVLEMEVGSLGIPEFGTRFVRQMLEDTRPDAFSELVRISGFSHGTDVWLNNAQELIREGTAQLSEAISTRDDIMVSLMQKGLESLMAFKIMEDVRKGKGLKPEYEETMKHHGVPEWYIRSCKKIKYMFPKAHAVAYVTMAFRIAWYKVNHPEAFYAAYFTVRADEFDLEIIAAGSQAVRRAMNEYDRLPKLTAREKSVYTILELALEMYARGIRLEPLDLQRSQATSFSFGRGSLLPPFNAMAGLGEKAARAVVAAREDHPFASVEDLRIRGKLSSTLIDRLKTMGVLDGLPESEQMSLFDGDCLAI